MKRKELEVFMAVKEAGDFAIEKMKQGKTVRLDYGRITSDLNKKFSTSTPLKMEQIKQVIEGYIYNNCTEYRECGLHFNSDFEYKEYILKDYIAYGANFIIDSFKICEEKKLQLVTVYKDVLDEIKSEPELNGLNITMDELEHMVNNYIEKNSGNIRIVHETINTEMHAVMYRAA